jgi:hypothetical protein
MLVELAFVVIQSVAHVLDPMPAIEILDPIAFVKIFAAVFEDPIPMLLVVDPVASIVLVKLAKP